MSSGAEPFAPSQYLPDGRPRWLVLGLITLLHVAGFIALGSLDLPAVLRLRQPPLVIDLLPLEPPPEIVTLPTKKPVAAVEPDPVRLVSPQLIVSTPAPRVEVRTVPVQPPAPPAPIEAPPRDPAPRPATRVVDLGAACSRPRRRATRRTRAAGTRAEPSFSRSS